MSQWQIIATEHISCLSYKQRPAHTVCRAARVWHPRQVCGAQYKTLTKRYGVDNASFYAQVGPRHMMISSQSLHTLVMTVTHLAHDKLAASLLVSPLVMEV
jgi:hypothetical protein